VNARGHLEGGGGGGLFGFIELNLYPGGKNYFWGGKTSPSKVVKKVGANEKSKTSLWVKKGGEWLEELVLGGVGM